MNQIKKYHKKIYKLIISGEHYYYLLATNYQLKNLDSSDLDNELKSKYNKQAILCRKFAEEFVSIPLPQNSNELPNYVDGIKNHLANMPALRLIISNDDPESEIQKILENLIFTAKDEI